MTIYHRVCKTIKVEVIGASVMLAIMAGAFGWSQVRTGTDSAALVNEEEAEILIYAMPGAQAERENGKDVACTPETNKEYDHENFYYFWVVGTGEAHHEGSITLGYFAVNKHTSDIWEYATMEHIQSAQLLGIQKIIRKYHHIDEAVLKKYGGLQPNI